MEKNSAVVDWAHMLGLREAEKNVKPHMNISYPLEFLFCIMEIYFKGSDDQIIKNSVWMWL